MSDESRYKLLTDLDRYELINISDGERYDFLQNNDIIIDDEGNLKYLIIKIGSKFSLFGSSNEFLEIPWSCVKKIGTKTIILDAEDEMIRKNS